MKISAAKQAYSAQLNTLWDKKRALTKRIEEQEQSGEIFDQVEIRRELSQVESQYKATQNVMESILAQDTAIQNRESAKQQGEALSKAADEMMKMMEIYRRIASGGKVPAKDEYKLMEYNHELYMAAKAAAMLHRDEDKEYDSLWDDEEEPEGENASPSDIAGNTEISVPAPEAVAAEAAAAAETL